MSVSTSRRKSRKPQGCIFFDDRVIPIQLAVVLTITPARKESSIVCFDGRTGIYSSASRPFSACMRLVLEIHTMTIHDQPQPGAAALRAVRRARAAH